jgi:hypothetical protein
MERSLELLRVAHGEQQIEGGFGPHRLKQFFRVVFAIGEDQRSGFWGGVQDAGGELKQGRGDLGHGHGGGGEKQADRLMGFEVEAEEGGGDLGGADSRIIAITGHLALAGAGQSVWV